MNLIVGADHAGFKLKEEIVKYLKKTKISYEDIGTFSEDRVDYPDIAQLVVEKVIKDSNNKGILICGTGTGMVMAANKVKGIRAALIYDEYTAKMAREHNNTNIACLRGRKFSQQKALKILKIWLKTPFSNEVRHKRRLEKIAKYEEKFHVCLP